MSFLDTLYSAGYLKTAHAFTALKNKIGSTLNIKMISDLRKFRTYAFGLDHIPAKEAFLPVGRPVYLFFATIVFYIIYLLILQPNWVLGGEMWAEMGNNYFPNAQADSYWQNFFATDSGYIPFPLRIIAFLGKILSLKASLIPYYYTWVSITLTALLVGVFCLAPFRHVVKSDYLRFATCISVLIIVDFHTRNFISCTYFSAFFATILTALALVDDSEEVPWWAWFLPILVISKPAVLAVIPAMAATAFVSRRRFRRITIVSVFFALLQLGQMYISQKGGVMPLQESGLSLTDKLTAAGEFFLGILMAVFAGPSYFSEIRAPEPKIWIGGFIICICIYYLFKIRRKSNTLIIIGLSMLAFNMLLNCFALSKLWNVHSPYLSGAFIFDRSMIVGFFGGVFTVVGIISSSMEARVPNKHPNQAEFLNSTLFAVVFAISWLTYGLQISREPGAPYLNISQWQNMAAAIDSSEPSLCVPINPLGWMYSRNCFWLTSDWSMHQSNPIAFEKPAATNEPFLLTVSTPSSVTGKTIISFGIIIKPLTEIPSTITAKAAFHIKGDTPEDFTASGTFQPSGGMLFFTGQHSHGNKDVASVDITFNAPVEVMLNNANKKPAVFWFGF